MRTHTQSLIVSIFELISVELEGVVSKTWTCRAGVGGPRDGGPRVFTWLFLLPARESLPGLPCRGGPASGSAEAPPGPVDAAADPFLPR